MQMKSKSRSNAARSAEMRARLVATARRLFVAEGYGGASTPAIVTAAGVTRGALYHHFPDKQAIFRAVIEAEAEAVACAIAEADAPGMSAMDRLLAGAASYLRAMQEDGRVRLLLIDGPAVLGQAAMRTIEARQGEGALRLGLEEAMDEGAIAPLPLGPLSSLLAAMFERAAMDLAEGAPAAPVRATIEAILRGLARSSPAPRT